MTKYKIKISIAMAVLGVGASINSINAQMYGAGYTILNDQTTSHADLKQNVHRPLVQASTIRDGLNIVLEGTSWRLAGDSANDPQIFRLFNTPWPQKWRSIGPDQLGNVLTAIGGDGWQLVIDPVNRLVSYEVRPQFRGGAR